MSRYMVELFSTAGLVATLNGPSNLATLAAEAIPFSAPIRHVHRDRNAEFGVGYGNSSGYATDRHYVSEWSPQRFRCF
jgi:hypothetical protein